MKNIISFDSYNEFDEFLGSTCSKRIVGSGGEGCCILGRDGKNIYKVFERFGCCDSPVVPYDVNKVITTNDIDLKRYILPSELYALKGILIGYKTKYIKGEDLFSAVNLTRLHDERNLINFNALIKSYYEMKKETDLLSKEKIGLFDLTYNVMFVNNNLYGIDTCGYKKGNIDVSARNTRMLEEAFTHMFEEWMMYDEYLSDDDWLGLSEEKNMDKYFKKLEKIIKRG